MAHVTLVPLTASDDGSICDPCRIVNPEQALNRRDVRNSGGAIESDRPQPGADIVLGDPCSRLEVDHVKHVGDQATGQQQIAHGIDSQRPYAKDRTYTSLQLEGLGIKS